MALLFNIQVSPHPKGFGKPAVHAQLSPTGTGVFDEVTQEIYQPSRDELRNVLPHYWRKAYDRNPNFWYDNLARVNRDRCSTVPYLPLYGARGQRLATIYATPYHFEP